MGGPYQVSVFVNGAFVFPSSWSVSTGPYQVASGHSSLINFTARVAAAHTIHAMVVGDFGLYQQVAVTLNVTSQPGTGEAGVVWTKLVFMPGENLTAKIVARDSRGVPAKRIVWTLYRNSAAILSGEGTGLNFVGTMPGLYRLKGIAYGGDDSQLLFDSTAFVDGVVNVRHSLPLPEYDGTMVFVGSVFSQNLAASSGRATSLPYKTASATEDILLLPGTTHYSFDLDPDATPVDDEVVVRTKRGNWCLNGLAGGLTGQDIGYDYGYMPAMIPAPIDRRIRFTAETFKVNGLDYNSFNSRVRINCYRQLGQPVYRYERCTYSSFPGGEGRRNRRWAVMFTGVDLQTDVFSGLNRLGTGSNTIAFTTDNVTSVPMMTLTPHGTPNPVPGYSGLFYTDSNLYAYYEADGKINLEANAISAIESVRPCCISLLMFNNAKPLISNRIKRLHGKLVLFLTDGSVFQGSVVNVKIYTADGLFSTTVPVTVQSPCYVDADDVILKVAEADIDLSDFQFDETGIVAEITVDESSAIVSPIPVPAPTPVVGPEFIFSPVYSHTVTYDGACYTNPTYTPSIDGDAVVVTPVGGCQEPSCGPQAQYCYEALDAPAEFTGLPQPFGMPAPFVAYGSNPARCFYNPIPRGFFEIVGTITGTVAGIGTYTSTDLFTGSFAVDLWAYSDGSLCGYSYAYNTCNSYGTCVGHNCSMIVVYPVSSSPHPVIEYAGRCFSFAGSTQDYGTRQVIGSGSVVPAFDCAACAGMVVDGSVVVYNDMQTSLEVPVCFDHIDSGIPYYAAAAQIVDEGRSGLTEGLKVVTLSQANTQVYIAPGTGSMMFEFGRLSGKPKQVLVDRAGAHTVYNPGMGGTRQIVNLQTGDVVYLRVADPYGRVPLQYKNLRVTVTWHPIEFLPRLFDTVVVPYSGSTTLNGVGFCAYTNEGVYSYYGTLPYSGSMTGPVNPDSIVTVTGTDGQEYNLIQVHAIGDPNQHELTQLPWYGGQTLYGPFTFKFYAGRKAFGAHGEMDVWFNSDGTFPAYLRAGDYDVLELPGTYYRRNLEFTDTRRNSYAVLDPAYLSALEWPTAYVAADGQVIIAAFTASAATYEGKTFNAPYWPEPVYDPGLSYVILSGNSIFNVDIWGNDAGEPWLTDAGLPWSA